MDYRIMNIETNRLLLVPIDLEIISAILNNDLKSNESHNYYHNTEWPEKDLKEALPVFKELLDSNGKDGFNLWLIIEKETKLIIGSAGYVGKPDKEGNIEIGFGIIPSKRRKGFCNESVKALIEWGLSHDEVNAVIACCDKTNVASRKIIEKLGFQYIQEKDNLFEWKIR